MSVDYMEVYRIGYYCWREKDEIDKKTPTRRYRDFYTPTYLPLTGAGDEIQWLECRCTMCDSQQNLVASSSVKSEVEAQECRLEVASVEQDTKMARKSNVVDVMFGRRSVERSG